MIDDRPPRRARRRRVQRARSRRPHPCRADLDREEAGALDTLRPHRPGPHPDPPHPASSASVRAQSSRSCAGRPTTSARSSRASTWCARSQPTSPIRRCRSCGRAATSCSGSRAGPRSSRCSPRSTRWKRPGVDPCDAAADHWRHVHNRIAAGHQSRASIRSSVIAPGSSAGRSRDEAPPLCHGDGHRRIRLRRGLRRHRRRRSTSARHLERQRQRADRALPDTAGERSTHRRAGRPRAARTAGALAFGARLSAPKACRS